MRENSRELRSLAGTGSALPLNALQDLLAGAGVIDGALASRLAAAIGLRNRIARANGTLDLDRVYEAARDEREDLDALAAASLSSGPP